MTMNSSLRLIDALAARTHGWQPVKDHRFALQQPTVAVQLSEVAALVPTLPLAFAKVAQGQFTLVAVTGFADGRNQLIDNEGRWCVLYQPVEMRCYPFSVQPFEQLQQGSSAYGMCFNHDSGLYREAPDESVGEQRFFGEDGQPQPWFRQIMQLLQNNVAQRKRTLRAVKALHDAELMIPWRIESPKSAPEERLPRGLFRVDEVKLNQLKGAALESLHQANAMALAYAQLFSMSRLVVIKRLKDAHAANQRHTQASAAVSPPAPDTAIVKQLFEPGQPDTIQFNW